MYALCTPSNTLGMPSAATPHVHQAVSGVAIGVHFGAWVASVDMTTLTHSLLFVSSHPVVRTIALSAE